MKSIKEFFLGTSSYTQVLPFVFSNGIWSFFVWPLTFNLLLFIGLVYVIIVTSTALHSLVLTFMASIGLMDVSWIAFIITWLLSYGAKLFFLYLVWQFYQLLSLIFLAPLFSYLSEKIQEVITGREAVFSLNQFIKDVIRGIRIAIRNIFFQCLWIALFYIICFMIPILTPFLPLALFLVGAYYYGFAMIDYRSEFYHLSPKESRLFVQNHRWYALGNGIVFQTLLFIPIIGTLFAPPLALVAAALGLEKLRE